jgi:hypothetical protein
MGIFGKWLTKRNDAKILERILEKMSMPPDEIAAFKARVGHEDYDMLAKVADELVSQEKKKVTSSNKVNLSPWGIEQISKIVNKLVSLMRIVGPKLPVTSSIWLPIIMKEEGPALFLHFTREAVEDVITEEAS